MRFEKVGRQGDEAGARIHTRELPLGPRQTVHAREQDHTGAGLAIRGSSEEAINIVGAGLVAGVE
jgi:hypothetical protein